MFGWLLRLPKRLWPSTLRRQIMVLILFAILLVHLGGGIGELLANSDTLGIGKAEQYTQRAAALADMIALADATERPEVLRLARALGFDFSVQPLSSPDGIMLADTNAHFGRRVMAVLFPQESLIPSGASQASVGDRHVLVFPLGSDDALVLSSLPATFYPTDFVNPLGYYVVAIIVLIGLFSVFSVRAITAPLDRISRTLENTDHFLAQENGVQERGSAEILRLSSAVNDMRSRIHSMLDSRTRMLRSISHDLRTPLTRLRLRVERTFADDPQQSILSDIDQINGLIDETLEYLRDTRHTLVRTERVDLPSLLQTVCDDFATVSEDIAYLGPDHLVIECSATEITRALSNLCDNARKFGTQTRVVLSAHPDEVVIEVRDNGPGIPAAMRDKVTEPFFSLDPARNQKSQSGFGLGLAIVQDIATSHNGRLEIEDNRPRGAILRLTLPKRQDSPRNAQ